MDSANNRLKYLRDISSSPSYSTEIIAGSGNELRAGVLFPDSHVDAKTADKRPVRNGTQDVYFTERVRLCILHVSMSKA